MPAAVKIANRFVSRIRLSIRVPQLADFIAVNCLDEWPCLTLIRKTQECHESRRTGCRFEAEMMEERTTMQCARQVAGRWATIRFLKCSKTQATSIDNFQVHLDVATRRVRVGAYLMGVLDERFCSSPVDARDRDFEVDTQFVEMAVLDQGNRREDR